LAELKRLAKIFPDEVKKLLDANPELAGHIGFINRNPIYAYEPFETKPGLLPDGNVKSSPVKFHRDLKKIRVVVTGNRCSKTYSASAEVIAGCTGIDPITKHRWAKIPTAYKERYKPPQDVWVISNTEEFSVETVQRTYHDLIPQDALDNSTLYTEKNGWKANFIKFTNGSTIRFKFSSQGRETFQGTYKHKIHLDEEQPYDIYKECLARTTPVGGRPRGEIIISFTPIYNPAIGISWVHKELYARRLEIPEVSFHFWTLFDVPDYIITDAEKDSLAKSYDEDEREVRVYGMFTPTGMVLAFPRSIIGEQRAECKEFTEGEIVEIEKEVEVAVENIVYLPEGHEAPKTKEIKKVYDFVPQESNLRIYKKPVEGHKYVLGADPAQGRTMSKDSDEQAFYVIDRNTWPYEVVAEFTGNIDPHELGEEIFRTGKYYNDAYILVENNADLTPIEYLRVNEYPNLHYQCVIEGRIYDKQTDKIGWNTNVRTRRKLRNDALLMFRNKEIWIRSERIISQMETFARAYNGRWEAIAGAHDDRIFAFMIACQGLEYAGIIDDWRDEGLLEAGPEVDPDRIYAPTIFLLPGCILA